MWGDKVRVTTRPYEEATRATQVLEFEKGLNIRPLLRPGDPSELIKDGGTRVRGWPRGVEDARSDWLAVPRQRELLYGEKVDPITVARWLCQSLDVDLVAEAEHGELTSLIAASDWLHLDGEGLLRRIDRHPYGDYTARTAASIVWPLMDGEKVVGRAPRRTHHRKRFGSSTPWRGSQAGHEASPPGDSGDRCRMGTRRLRNLDRGY
jgi:hypothetical protein